MAQPKPQNHAHRENHKQYAPLTHHSPQKHLVLAAVLTQSKPVSITAVRPVSAAVPKIKGNPQHALKDKGVIDSGCSRHMTWNMSYLSNFEELNGGYVAFEGSGPTWLFDIDNLTRTMNYQPVTTGNQSNSSNNDGDAAFNGKEPDFDVKKPESEVNVSLSSSALSRKQDDKTKKEAKGKSPIESFIGYRDLTAEFEDCSDNSINEINDAELEDINYSDDEDDVGAEDDFNNLEISITEEPNRVHQALKDPSWIEAMQEELLQFKMQKVWILVDLPSGKRAIGTKWEEGIDYEEVFAPVARIEAIRLSLAYASFMGFMVYLMDVKSAFLYGTIEEEVYVCQPSGFEDLDHPDKVYKVVKVLYGLHQAPRAVVVQENFLAQDEEDLVQEEEGLFQG
nr:hypothetical protein [Tanacetum cinerariifolium]